MSETIFAYHASHEQFPPSELLRLAVAAEQAGFRAISSSDHFHPWNERQGESGFAFSWLGAAMAQTNIPFSSVCAPGQRYHPAIVAQATATLNEMFPGRYSIALGSGEALNENITGAPWPTKLTRNERLFESYNVIHRLLKGERVDHSGHIKVSGARLFTRPETMPLLLCAAVTKETASWAGKWAPGLITTYRPIPELQEVISSFRANGGSGKPVWIKVQVSYGLDYQKALTDAHQQWATNIFSSDILANISSIAEFEAAAGKISEGDMPAHVLISSNPWRYVDWLNELMELGCERIILHNVNLEQDLFIRDFGKLVIPSLKSARQR